MCNVHDDEQRYDMNNFAYILMDCATHMDGISEKSIIDDHTDTANSCASSRVCSLRRWSCSSFAKRTLSAGEGG